MQMNEIAGQVRQGPPVPHAEQAIAARRATPETRPERPAAGEPRRPAGRLPVRPRCSYGAGF